MPYARVESGVNEVTLPIDQLPDAAVIVDAGGAIRALNVVAEKMFGYSDCELAGQSVEVLVPEALRRSHRDLSARYRRAPQVRSMGRSSLVSVQCKDGSLKAADIMLAPLGSDGTVLALVRDMTDYLAMHAELESSGYIDRLTGLGNRQALQRDLSYWLSCPDSEHWLTLVLLNVDGFRSINTQCGQAAADSILVEAAARLKSCANRNVSTYRLYADEFAMVYPFAIDTAQVADQLEAVLSALREPYMAGSKQLGLNWSIGIVCAPEQGTTSDLLLSNAELAMYLSDKRQLQALLRRSRA